MFIKTLSMNNPRRFFIIMLEILFSCIISQFGSRLNVLPFIVDHGERYTFLRMISMRENIS